MDEKAISVLVVGFNTRPLAYSLNEAGYDVYAVDFFGDLDLHPCVKDSIVVIKKLGSNYSTMKLNYAKYLASFTQELLQRHPEINYIIIGSGLDDAFEERKSILNYLARVNQEISSLNNDIQTFKKARDLDLLHQILTSNGYRVPKTRNFEAIQDIESEFKYPIILKKRTGSGGINVLKINSDFELNLHLQQDPDLDMSNWMIQEYIDGLPVSCTTISNGEECEVLSINRQIIGFDFVNAPKEFMYCGNIVPANVLPKERDLLIEISILLTRILKLKGINGFDFVLRNNYPYFMEVNPRIPGSIRVSEEAMQLNLLELHVLSFKKSKWQFIINSIKSAPFNVFSTKLIFFAPKKISKSLINKINELENIHDKSEPKEDKDIGEPVCTILYNDHDFSSSYFGALKIVDKIKKIIE